MKILITGCAGFIGFHLANLLCKNFSYKVYGIDNLNNYYDIKLKTDRIKILKENNNFLFKKINIANKNKLLDNFKKNKYDCVINLAAQAGVRNSITNPDQYVESNLIGFYNILEASKTYKIKHLLTASTSSVYGLNRKFPLKEDFNTDFPLSFYAATKKSNEVMAYSYSNIFKLPITVMRFFTVYGPYGRPDMALFKFTKGISNKTKIDVFNNGKHVRDFTYIDDVTHSIELLIKKPPKNLIPYEIYNISSSNPEKLGFFIKLIEKNLNVKGRLNYKDLQKGDVIKTFGSNKKIVNKIKFKPVTKINEGIKKFIIWYKKYYEK
jgi:UDP-glucuronate 4-epimerase